jgi:hypothetical protein
VYEQTEESKPLCRSRTSTSIPTPRTDAPQAHRAATIHTGDRPSHTNNSCSPVTTPMDPGVKLSTSMCPSCPEDIAFMKDKPYISAVGSLLYLAICTHPGISYAVGVLSCFTSNPGPAHWKAVKHLFCYLKGTADLRLVYAPDASGKLFTSYSDADHGGNPDNGRSTSGYILKIGTGAIS